MTASSSAPFHFTAHDGVDIACTRWGEAEPLVVMVHATGFCKELCAPIVDDIASHGIDFSAVAIDQRAHGDSGVPPLPFDWWDVARDVVELVGSSRPVIGVGHSAGGAVLAMAEMLQPGTFASFVLVEPIILPPPYGRYPDNPMSVGALRRKPGFTSRQAAYDNFIRKVAFAGWQPRAMRAYVDGGLRDGDDGVVLKCLPEHEAAFFEAATDHRAWDRLGEVETRAILLAGSESTTHQEPFLAELATRLPNARYEIIPDTSHFVWMENPAAIADRVVDAIGDL